MVNREWYPSESEGYFRIVSITGYPQKVMFFASKKAELELDPYRYDLVSPAYYSCEEDAEKDLEMIEKSEAGYFWKPEPGETHYRLYGNRICFMPRIICVQNVDYADYDSSEFANDIYFASKAEAEFYMWWEHNKP